MVSGKSGGEDKIEVQMQWETGAVSAECSNLLYIEMPVELTVYSKDNDLLEGEGWNKLRRLTNQSKLIEKLVKQTKHRFFRISPRCKNGFEVLRNYDDAKRLNAKNCNTR